MIYEKISSRQLLFSVICFFISSSLMTDYWFFTTHHDTWLVVIFGGLLTFLFSFIYLALARRFPGKTLIQINEIVYGPIAGRMISLLYVFFFLTICAIGTRNVGDFVTGYMMPETPMIVVIIMLLLVSGWAAREGARCLTGISMTIVVIMAISFLFGAFLLFPNMNVENFLPILQKNWTTYLKGTHVVTVIPFCEIMVFMMVIPFAVDQQKVKKTFLWGIVIGVSLVLLIIVRDTSVLGILVNYVSLPAYESLRMINIGDVLTRIEVLYAFGLVLLFFFHVALFLYASSTAIAQICHLRSHKALVNPLAVIVMVYAMRCFDSNVQRLNWTISVEPFYNSLMEIVLPLLTLVIAAIRFRQPNPLEVPQS